MLQRGATGGSGDGAANETSSHRCLPGSRRSPGDATGCRWAALWLPLGDQRELTDQGPGRGEAARARGTGPVAFQVARRFGKRPARSRGTRRGRDIAALAGHWYREQLAAYGDNPGSPDGWEPILDRLADQVEPEPDHNGDLVVRLTTNDRQQASDLLSAHGFKITPIAIEQVGQAVFQAEVRFLKLMQQRGRGDWSPDPAHSAISGPCRDGRQACKPCFCGPLSPNCSRVSPWIEGGEGSTQSPSHGRCMTGNEP